MKLKYDFVTNSSSTSYVIGIPNNFNIEHHLRIKEKMGIGLEFVDDADIEYYCKENNIPKIEAYNDILKSLKLMFNSSSRITIDVPSMALPSKDLLLFMCVVGLAKSLNLILATIEIDSGDANDIALLIPENDICNFFNSWRAHEIKT